MKFTTLLLALIISSKLFGQDYGMVRVDSNLWVDQTEITNSEYRQFVNWVKDSIARNILFDSGLKKYGKTNNNIDGNFTPNWHQTLDYSDTAIISVLESKEFWYPEENRFKTEMKEINASILNYQFFNSAGAITKTNIYPDTMSFERPFIKANGDSILFWYSSSLVKRYFWHPHYDDYPGVGSNYSQAIAFSHWRTNLYNNFAKEKGLSKAVKYALPSIDDMYTISTKSSQLHQEAGKSMYWGGLLDPEPLSVLNRFYESEVQYRKELSKYLKKLGEVKSKGQLDKEELNYPFYIVSNEYMLNHPVSAKDCFGVPSSFAKNSNSLIYGLSGNVAEMLIDKEVIGGSFLHPLEKCQIDELIEWDVSISSQWLGFRCIMYQEEDHLLTKPKPH